MTEAQKKAMDEAVEELAKMSPEEFRVALEKSKDGDLFKILEESYQSMPLPPKRSIEIDLKFKAIELTVINIKPGDTLAVTIKSDDMDGVTINALKDNFQKQFPKNKILIFGLGLNDSLEFTVLSEGKLENKENKGCNTANFCVDCNCGKKDAQ